MTRGKTITLFLMDGNAQGRRKATLSNWTGVAYLIPRTDLAISRDREDLKKTGVYLLFGRDDEDVEKVYIGQARERKDSSGILQRISEHVGERNLDYWTSAVAFVTSSNSFGPTEISYLENQFVNMALAAKRYVVTNGNEPSPGTVTEEKQAELDEFIDNARLVIGALGFPVFEPIDEAKASPNDVDTVELQMSYRSTTAKGRQTNDGFVLLAGAQLCPDDQFNNSCPDSVRKRRQEFRHSIDANFVTTDDLLFNSPSGAAEFVGGSSLSGPEYWKDASGKSLKQLEQERINQIEDSGGV